MSDFRSKHTLEKRQALSKRIRDEHAERVPVILELAKRTRGSTQEMPPLKNEKVLVQTDSTVGKMILQIRASMNLRSDMALFLFVGRGVIPPTGALVGHIYERYKDADGFLYVTVTSESTFGGY